MDQRSCRGAFAGFALSLVVFFASEKGVFLMGMQAGGTGGLQSEINVTPMVDVMLVLLIIFMVVTPFLQKDVSVAIPRDMEHADEDLVINREDSVIISIPKDNDYYLGKKQ